jgi:hypothetical protein
MRLVDYLRRWISHQDPDGTSIRSSSCKRSSLGFLYVQESKLASAGQSAHGGLRQNQVHQGSIPAGYKVLNTVAGKNTRGVFRRGVHQSVRLVGAAPGKPLLGLAARSRSGLNVAVSAFGFQDLAATCHSHGETAPTHQQDTKAAFLACQSGKPLDISGAAAWTSIDRPRCLEEGRSPVSGEEEDSAVVSLFSEWAMALGKAIHPTGQP